MTRKKPGAEPFSDAALDALIGQTRGLAELGTLLRQLK